eukprot:XP_011679153.1 PREDICTED: uncharacterized protein LOC100891589 isoform X1 [Strongylocentrotus purpuratus]
MPDEESGQPASDRESPTSPDQPQAVSHLDTSSQCDLQVESDADTGSVTAESVSSTEYKLRSRPKTAPNHFRTQTAPSRLQRHRKPVKPSKPRHQQGNSADNISDVSSESSSLDRAYTHRITSQVSRDAPGFYEYHRPYSVYRKPLRRPLSLPTAFDDSPKLNHPDLDPGQREYLWHTASVYSVGNLKQLQQRRYKQILNHQVETGFHTKEECDRYYKYLMGTRKQQYAADTTVWRSPPKLPVRPKQFQRRPRAQEEVEETRRVNTGYYRGQKSKEKGSKENLNDSMEKLSLVYSTDLKRTLPRKRKDSVE